MTDAADEPAEENKEQRWRAFRADSFARLLENNPKQQLGLLNLYADAFAEYSQAMENIGRCGVVVGHPRTGAPIDNPYIKIRDAAARSLKDPRFMRLKTDPLWEAKP
ncbi:MAG TPA: hypothetical protein VGJ91_20060 [Polyangiaceae bacterium]|jgi:phage terminase small subunit